MGGRTKNPAYERGGEVINMRKFKELQTELFNMEITRTDLAKMMGRSVTYLTDRFSRKKPFTLDDVYFLCDTLGISYADIPKYFPQKD